ncbi:AraC family transcriptional regulator [Paenibacillus roseipurpureus]|uniref:AraC family transcriptional regulator n=1 Tax=Paenibacillus roseopurpureus TaxID=2918901 RepID=A0AA96LU17_9BACL|nr:AraC family transcriptional regulator [Paenibacillus sp. MBLB1832]WNR46074.1 AraC family transcriptional regulator [Paenibacillus sp. MBLB1832]
MKKHIYIDENENYEFRFGDLMVRILNVTRVFPSRDWRVGEHSHTCYELHVIPAGEGIVTIEGRELHVRGGQFYITGPYIEHAQQVVEANPMSEYCLRWELIPLSDHTAESDEYRTLKKYLSHCYPYAFEDTNRIDHKFERIFTELQVPRVGSQLRIQAILVDIMVDVVQSVDIFGNARKLMEAEEVLRLNRILEFIQKEYHRPITAEEVSCLLFLSPRQINRLLQKRTGCSLGELIIRRRLEMAITALRQTKLTIEEIAIRCGFTSRYYMYEVFRKHGYPSPGEVRKVNHA